MHPKVTQAELAAIKLAMDKEKVARVFKRYQALYLYFSGKTCSEIADIVGITPATVGTLYKIYTSEGLAGVPDKSIPGRPPRLTLEQRTSLKQVILHKLPADIGFPTKYQWTASLIGKYINREYSYSYSIRGITGLLKHMGIYYTHQTYELAKPDKKKWQKYVKNLEIAEKTLNDELQLILLGDACATRSCVMPT